MGDAWDDEGFGGEDDWQGDESVGAGLEDELAAFGDVEDDETLDGLDEDDD